MGTQLELYHEEIKRLKDFRSKIATNAIYKVDLEEFSNDYEELITQTKVITRVSDRLQKKLDNANQQINEQNVEIKATNKQLTNTIYKLAEAQIGKKASTIMIATALILFFLEQYYLEPIIEQSIPLSYSFLSIIMLIIIFFSVKFLESRLEKYFIKKEKRRILLEKRKKSFD